MSVLSVSVLFAAAAEAGVIVFQPGPSTSKDIWTTSFYSYAPGGGGPGGGLVNDRLRVGGWGDTYYSLLQFDVSKLPGAVNSATLRLYNNPAGSNATAVNLARIDEAWDWKTMGTGSDRERLWWADRPDATVIRSNIDVSPTGAYTNIDVTDLYNAWKSEATANNGLELQPVSTFLNHFDEFSSSRDPTAAYRPALVLDVATEGKIDFGVPLKGGSEVHLTTMAGGLSASTATGTFCGTTVSTATPIDPCHYNDKAFYSLDFDQAAGAENAVVAASAGTVSQIIALESGDGFYAKVVVDHGSINGSAEHYFTIYQEFGHYGSEAEALASVAPYVHVGQTVVRGAQLGTLENVAGDHLHFQVSYGGVVGHSTDAFAAQLGNVALGGRLLTEFTLENTGGCVVTGPSTVSAGCHPTISVYGSAAAPILPTAMLGSSLLFSLTAGDLGLGVDKTVYFDPPSTFGYDFEILAGPSFGSIILPLQSADYALWLFDPLGAAYFSRYLTPGLRFDFEGGGVDRFRILGFAGGREFLPGLTFVSAGDVTFLETPIQTAAAVPESATWMLLLAGFGLVGSLVRQRRWSFVAIGG